MTDELRGEGIPADRTLISATFRVVQSSESRPALPDGATPCKHHPHLPAAKGRLCEACVSAEQQARDAADRRRQRSYRNFARLGHA